MKNDCPWLPDSRCTGRGKGGGLQSPSLFGQNANDSGKSSWDKFTVYRVQLLQHNQTVDLLPICRSLAIVNSMDKIINIFGQRHGREHYFF